MGAVRHSRGISRGGSRLVFAVHGGFWYMLQGESSAGRFIQNLKCFHVTKRNPSYERLMVTYPNQGMGGLGRGL
jgi:hypothetical protein